MSEMSEMSDLEQRTASTASRARGERDRDAACFEIAVVTNHHGSAVASSTASGGVALGRAPLLTRRLSLGRLSLVAPLAPSRVGVREITVREPRMTRLWERFSVDVGAARRRDAAFFDARVFERRQRDGYRVLIVEDGDRYAIRAACVFVVKAADGQVLELLHDRTVAGMSAASRLLGLAVREMAATGADRALAWSFAHSGSFPLFVRHAFLPARERTRRSVPELVVHAVSATSADLAAEGERAYVSLLDDPAA